MDTQSRSSVDLPKPSFDPLTTMRPAGFGAGIVVQSERRPDELKSLMKLAAKVLKDPLAVEQLSDRVYQLLHDELLLSQERRA